MKMNMSRTAAVGLILAAGLWIGSGYLLPHETADSHAAVRAKEQAPKLFRVAVIDAATEQHSRKLIETGALPKLDLVNLESQTKVAEALLSTAEAERDRSIVRAPWAGVVTDVPAEIGASAFSMAGKEIAQIIALDPMLAVVEAAERNLGGIKVGAPAEIRLVTGQKVSGKVRFVSKSAAAATRTYRVEVEIPNADGAIPDGITAEVALRMEPQPATRVSRSALTFSSSGTLGIRAVDSTGAVQFVPVSVIEDDQADMWVSGVAEGTRVIVQGQDFVREGQKVQPVNTRDAKVSQAQ